MKRDTLLCVDDDAAIRDLYQAMFATYGYEVRLAANPRQALELLQGQSDKVSAVISDYEMPGMNGAQLAAAVKRSHPDLPFILISGSPRDLKEAASLIDVSIPKGSPIKDLIEQVELALAPRRAASNPLAPYLSLGSALAGAASVAFLLSRVL